MRLFSEGMGRGRGRRGEHEGRREGGHERSGRMLGRGDLRWLLLAQIAEAPCHGYELIRRVSELFAGHYAPSAGVVYPALAQLEADGWVVSDSDGERRQYRLTPAGQAEVAAQRERIDEALLRTRHRAREVVKASLPAPVRDALRRVKRGLALRHGRWTDENAARVAEALERAADALERTDE